LRYTDDMALVFEQLFDPESSTYTYLIGDSDAKVAALIDPVAEQVERDLARVAAHGLRLVHTIETHVHADHVTGGGALAERTGSLPVVHRDSPVTCEAVRLANGDRFHVGALELQVLETPGHTPESLSFVLDGRVFTGDALLIGTCGRTDFQGGDAGALYDSIHARLFTLPDETIVYPAHDYAGHTSTTIGAEKHDNKRLAGKSRDEFITLMDGLGLPPPKKLDVALSANLGCGRPPQAR
jgi:sulfur dioxygenase